MLASFMRFSLQLRYAISGVFDLAYNGREKPIQIRVIGERQAIPTRYLEQIFQRLRRAGLVTAKRGPGGGYLLARSPATISLSEIIEAVEGPIDGGSVHPGQELSNSGEGNGPEFLWPLLADRFSEILQSITVADLCRSAARAGVRRLGLAPQDYQI